MINLKVDLLHISEGDYIIEKAYRYPVRRSPVDYSYGKKN